MGRGCTAAGIAIWRACPKKTTAGFVTVKIGKIEPCGMVLSTSSVISDGSVGPATSKSTSAVVEF
eukprot:10592809-Ditylum_brightwellii.AAC.1